MKNLPKNPREIHVLHFFRLLEDIETAENIVSCERPIDGPAKLVALALAFRLLGIDTADSALDAVLEIARDPDTSFQGWRPSDAHCCRAVDYAWNRNCPEFRYWDGPPRWDKFVPQTNYRAVVDGRLNFDRF